MTLLDAPAEPDVIAPIRPTDSERRFGMSGVRWATYIHLSDDIARGATRVTYDRGRMEIVVVSNKHEQIEKVLARIIEGYADEARIVAEGYGNVTIRHEGLERGLEPDESYFVANAARMIALRQEQEDGDVRPLDLTVHPPPDLAIEVDISPPDVAKPPIYGAMGVPEIWRFNGRAVEYLTRTADGAYVVADRSLAFPELPLGWVNELLVIGLTQGQSTAIAELRQRMAAL